MPELLCVRTPDRKPTLVNGKPQLLIELFEGSTYENAHILDADFIQGLESAYTGQMRERFLLGKWGAYDGLIYPVWNEGVHTVDQSDMGYHLQDMQARGYDVNFFEGYDYGIAVPACYGLWFVDNDGNAMLLDGFHQKELGINQQRDKIVAIRSRWGIDPDNLVFADPAIFRRTNSTDVGSTISAQFEDIGIRMRRGQNDKMSGIMKVTSYLYIRPFHLNPFTGTAPAPSMYVNRDLNWYADEIGNYYWKKNTKGEVEDETQDKNDHALDMNRYAFTDIPKIARVDASKVDPPGFMSWQESDLKENRRDYRHGR